MNIIHNSALKFIPNTIFAQSIDHDHDYSHQNVNPTHQNNQQNISASIKSKSSLQQPPLFQDKTNLQAKLGERDSEKKTTVMNLTPKKVNIQSNITKESEFQNSQVPVHESDNSRKLKYKKKVSTKKKNLQQLFDEIQEKAGNDCVFLENHNQNNREQVQNSSKSLKSSSKEKNRSESNTNLNSRQQNQLNGNQSSKQGEETSQNNALFKINKFHFLHNQLNLDSSSEEQGEIQVKENKIPASSQSENDEDKIDFVMPKIKSRHNFFIKKEDLNLDSSDESEQEQKEGDNIQQTPQKTDPINDQSQQDNQKTSPQTSSRTINVTDFRREFVEPNQEYLKKPLPEGVSIDLIIKRDKSKKNSDFIEYSLYDSKTLRMIVVVVKKSGLHEIMAKKNVQDPKAHPDVKYLAAKLQSNFLGSEFTLKYVPKPNLPPTKSSKALQLQQIAATICYQTNILGFKGPRKMSIYIPQHESVKYYGDKSLQQHYQKKCNHRIQKYINKQARWNKQVQSYVLNLKGKARLSSVKNFVIVKDDKGQEIKQDEKSFVIFGKISKEIFNLSISGPFSIIQGLALAVSTFERKLICQ